MVGYIEDRRLDPTDRRLERRAARRDKGHDILGRQTTLILRYGFLSVEPFPSEDRWLFLAKFTLPRGQSILPETRSSVVPSLPLRPIRPSLRTPTKKGVLANRHA